jgi:hypothetical protein
MSVRLAAAGALVWGPPSLASPPIPCYDDCGRGQMKTIKQRIIWVLVVVPLLTACQPLKDLGKTIEDLLKRFTG